MTRTQRAAAPTRPMTFAVRQCADVPATLAWDSASWRTRDEARDEARDSHDVTRPIPTL